MRVSQEILALLRIVSTGKQFYVRIQGLEEDKRFPNGIALSTTFDTLVEAEQFRIDVAKYLYFLKKPTAKINSEADYADQPYWDEYYSGIVNLCKWLTDEMLADKEIYDFLGDAIKSNIVPKLIIGCGIGGAEYNKFIKDKDNESNIAVMLKKHCISFVDSPNRHAPDFDIRIRGAKSKYYDCKICGYHSYHFSKQEATSEHSKYCKKIIPLKEKLKTLIK